MNLIFLVWSFGLGVLAGIILCDQIARRRLHKMRRIEAEAVHRMRAALWP